MAPTLSNPALSDLLPSATQSSSPLPTCFEYYYLDEDSFDYLRLILCAIVVTMLMTVWSIMYQSKFFYGGWFFYFRYGHGHYDDDPDFEVGQYPASDGSSVFSLPAYEQGYPVQFVAGESLPQVPVPVYHRARAHNIDNISAAASESGLRIAAAPIRVFTGNENNCIRPNLSNVTVEINQPAAVSEIEFGPELPTIQERLTIARNQVILMDREQTLNALEGNSTGVDRTTIIPEAELKAFRAGIKAHIQAQASARAEAVSSVDEITPAVELLTIRGGGGDGQAEFPGSADDLTRRIKEWINNSTVDSLASTGGQKKKPYHDVAKPMGKLAVWLSELKQKHLARKSDAELTVAAMTPEQETEAIFNHRNKALALLEGRDEVRK